MRKASGFLIGSIIVVLLAGTFAVVDVVARRMTEQEFARQLQSSLSMDSPPQISIGGWPFVAHVATGRYPSASLTAASFPVTYTEGTTVNVSELSVVATDVTSDGDDWVAQKVEGTAVIGYDELSTISPYPISWAGDGKVSITLDVLEWPNLDATVTGQVSLNTEAQELSLSDASIEAAGVRVPDGWSQQILDAVSDPIPVSHAQFQLTEATATADGVKVAITGSDVHLADLS